MMGDQDVHWTLVEAGELSQTNPMIRFHEEILDFVAHVSPTKDETAMRAEIVSRVTECVKSLWPEAELQMTGSYATGLFLPDSDIDLVVRGGRQPVDFGVDDPEGYNFGVMALHRDLELLAEALAEKGLARLEQIHIISTAKIPIVKFTDTVTNVGVDIAVDIDGSTETSDMIRMAVEHHASLRPLVMVLKTFLKQRGLNELFRGGLSSYGLVIMIIHFLQLYPVTPAKRRELAENTLGYEVLQFFKLYAYDFDYSNVICVREGGWAVPKKSLGWFDPCHPDAFAIEDPLFVARNVGEGIFCYGHIRAQFIEAYERLTCDGEPFLSSILIARSYEALDNQRRSALSRWRLSHKKRKRTVVPPRRRAQDADSQDVSTVKMTYMLRNIPNKYTRKTLLQDIDKDFQGTYDFFYLPIDFKQNCNRGYAFINFVNPEAALAFCAQYQGCEWTRFNSEKIGAVSAAHIQGQTQLIAHFQSSSIMQEDETMRPVLFHIDGPLQGQEKPFPAQEFAARKASKEKCVKLELAPPALPFPQPAEILDDMPAPMSPRRADWADIVEGERKAEVMASPAQAPTWSAVAAKVSDKSPASAPKRATPSAATHKTGKKPKAKRVRRYDEDEDDCLTREPQPSPRVARGWVRNRSGSGSGSDVTPSEWHVVTGKKRWRAVPAPPSTPTTPQRPVSSMSCDAPMTPCEAPPAVCVSAAAAACDDDASDAIARVICAAVCAVVGSGAECAADPAQRSDAAAPAPSTPAARADTSRPATPSADSKPAVALSVTKSARRPLFSSTSAPPTPSAKSHTPSRVSDFDFATSPRARDTLQDRERELEFSKLWSLPPTALWADICAE